MMSMHQQQNGMQVKLQNQNGQVDGQQMHPQYQNPEQALNMYYINMGKQHQMENPQGITGPQNVEESGAQENLKTETEAKSRDAQNFESSDQNQHNQQHQYHQQMMYAQQHNNMNHQQYQ